MNLFKKYIKKYFEFLNKDFNFYKFQFSESIGRFEPKKVAFAKNETTAVKIEYEEYDFDFDVQVIILGKSKSYDEEEKNDHIFIPLWIILEKRSSFWSKTVDYLYADPQKKYTSLNEQEMENFCKIYAEALLKTCKDLLLGNFEKLPEIKKYMTKKYEEISTDQRL